MRLPQHLLRHCLFFLLVASLPSCFAQSSPSAQVLYQEGRVLVQAEADPDYQAGAVSAPTAQSFTLDSAQLAQVLRAITFQTDPGLLHSLLSAGQSSKAAFTTEESSLLAPLLVKALTHIGPSERLHFSIANPRSGQNLRTTSGALSVRGSYLRFVLTDHPLIPWTLDNPSPKPVALEFPEQFLRRGSEQMRRGSTSLPPVLEIDYQQYVSSVANRPGQGLSAGQETAGKQSEELTGSRDEASATLQHLLQELTRTNLELRGEVQALRQQLEAVQAKAKDQPSGNADEVARLRQELAEVKQLLAEKVLELNRLRGKPKAPTKPKAESAR